MELFKTEKQLLTAVNDSLTAEPMIGTALPTKNFAVLVAALSAEIVIKLWPPKTKRKTDRQNDKMNVAVFLNKPTILLTLSPGATDEQTPNAKPIFIIGTIIKFITWVIISDNVKSIPEVRAELPIFPRAIKIPQNIGINTAIIPEKADILLSKRFIKSIKE